MSNKFQSDFTNAIIHIEKSNSISILEKVIEFYAGTVSNQNSFVNFQIQILNVVGPAYAPVIMHFLKNDVDYEPTKNHRQMFARLRNAKILVQHKFNQDEESLTNPFKLIGHIFTYSNQSPYHLTANFIRADGDNLRFLMTLNDGMMLLNTVTDNLLLKLEKGNNDIDVDLYKELKEKMNEYIDKLDSIIENEEKNQNVAGMD